MWYLAIVFLALILRNPNVVLDIQANKVSSHRNLSVVKPASEKSSHRCTTHLTILAPDSFSPILFFAAADGCASVDSEPMKVCLTGRHLQWKMRRRKNFSKEEERRKKLLAKKSWNVISVPGKKLLTGTESSEIDRFTDKTLTLEIFQLGHWGNHRFNV